MSNYSDSQIKQFAFCPLSWFYDRKLGLRKRGLGAVADHHLVFGKAIHEALRVLYSGGTLREATTTFEECYPVQLDPSDKAKTVEGGRLALEAYVSKWRDEDRKYEVLLCERPELNRDGSKLVLDLVRRDRQYGGIYATDHKTTGGSNVYLSESYWVQFETDSQVTRYIAHVRDRFGRCDGFEVNALAFGYRTKATRDRRTKELLPVGSWNRFGRQTFNRTNEQIELDRASQSYWNSRIDEVQDRADSASFGMNTRNCRWCAYRPICGPGQSWPSDEENILQSFYHVCGSVIEDNRERCVLEAEHEGECTAIHPVEPELVVTFDTDDELLEIEIS